MQTSAVLWLHRIRAITEAINIFNFVPQWTKSNKYRELTSVLKLVLNYYFLVHWGTKLKIFMASIIALIWCNQRTADVCK